MCPEVLADAGGSDVIAKCEHAMFSARAVW